jgi:hydrogenase small subunit
MIRGRTALSIVQEVCNNALATLAVGTCAWDGGLAAALPNPTGAVGVKDAVPGLQPLISLPGCPANVVNITATIAHYLTFDEWPRTDGLGRPRFAYHEELHDECERHDHYEAERFVRAWGDEGHRQGWCLLKMGCKGKRAHHNCPTVKWNDGTSWPVAAGHGCLGCAETNFWDRMSPFYAPIGGDDDDDDDGAPANREQRSVMPACFAAACGPIRHQGHDAEKNQLPDRLPRQTVDQSNRQPQPRFSRPYAVRDVGGI